jgi:hypothetical protein
MDNIFKETISLLEHYYNRKDFRYNYTGRTFEEWMKSGIENYIYVIYNPLNGLYKIGMTGDFLTRYNNLMNGSGCIFDIIIVLELGYIDKRAGFIEAMLHEYYDDKRIIGEWFKLNVKDINDIKELLWEIEGISINEGQFMENVTEDDIIYNHLIKENYNELKVVN